MTKLVTRPTQEFLAAEGAIGTANTLFGATIPTTVPAMGAKVCSFVCAKLASFWSWCFCASAVVIFAVGLAAFLIIGEVALQVRGVF